jgi:sirohydrochlorin ferrochelatase
VRTGIIVFGHGSSVPSANEAVKTVAADAARLGAWEVYETAFLEASPGLHDAVASLSRQGVQSILVLPYFLTLGIHLQRDLPKLVKDLEGRFAVEIRVARPLDGHEALSRILVERSVEQAGEQAVAPIGERTA